nr:MAG TPA: hypothetical protein [Caudoviricetes sp.]
MLVNIEKVIFLLRRLYREAAKAARLYLSGRSAPP